MQRCQSGVHRVINRGAIMQGELWQSGVPEDATVEILHHEELRAHRAVIAREVQHLWNRYVRAR